MKKLNKKGFTIVELVIVMAVIAILAAVMIPTFSGVINDAKETAAKSDAKAIYTQLAAYAADTDNDFDFEEGKVYYIVAGGYVFEVEDGAFEMPETLVPYVADNYEAATGITADWADSIKVEKTVVNP